MLLESGPKAHCVEDLSLKSYFNKEKRRQLFWIRGFFQSSASVGNAAMNPWEESKKKTVQKANNLDPD